ncbi:MAG: glycosyltransferase [Bacteroidaceae bacterium]|nr:glycosyltransferase [Bacteroidaceae bacterium]
MLSIIIPTKDYDCRELVKKLHKQAQELQLPFEIIIGEDGSSSEWISTNAPLAQLSGCRIIALEENIGRARIRNLLAEEAKCRNLIFIDSDAAVEHSAFLSNYANALAHNKVVCGGLYHSAKAPSKECSLRYRYEKRADKRRSAAIRNQSPYDNFTTFNFAIDREIFLNIKFNEKITRYGYEDTLFGHCLRNRNIDIRHIDNALLHKGLERNAVYLNKVEESVRTLTGIRSEIGDTPLLMAAKKIERLHMSSLIARLWELTNKILKKNLLSKHPSLTILNIYKLGFFCHISSNTRQK